MSRGDKPTDKDEQKRSVRQTEAGFADGGVPKDAERRARASKEAAGKTKPAPVRRRSDFAARKGRQPAEVGSGNQDSVDSPPLDVEAAIRRKAYEMFLMRGDGPGDATADWLAAERAVRGELSSPGS
jgi:hypothetical protein